jgi:rhodanese-related sulfurtransferase
MISTEDEKKRKLSQSYIFKDIPEEILYVFALIVEEKVIPAHTFIFRQGDQGDSFYIIDSGRVRVFRKGSEGLETELALLGQGDSFGEMALLTGETRAASVETLEETHLMTISKEQFDEVLKKHPIIATTFLKKLSNWLVKADQKVEREVERRYKVPRLSWVDIVIIVSLSFLISIIFNFSNPNGISFFPKSWSAEVVPTIACSKALQKYRDGNTLFIDAMQPNFFKQEHIKGALNLPLALFDIVYMLEVGEMDKEKEIIVYGKTISRLYDEEVARKLILRGHTNTKILEGGLSRWKKEGYPIES